MDSFNRKGKRGFTILEVLIATLIVGVGMFALMEAFNRGYFGVGQVEDYSLALSLSQEKMEELKDSSFTNITSALRAAVTGFPGFEQQVTVTNANTTELKQAVVTTYWNVPNGENSVTLTTFFVNAS